MNNINLLEKKKAFQLFVEGGSKFAGHNRVFSIQKNDLTKDWKNEQSHKCIGKKGLGL